MAQVTTEGREFWLGFMENYDVAPGQGFGNQSSLEIFITSKEVAVVEIFKFYDGQKIDLTINPGITHREVISLDNDNPYAATGSGNIENKAIKITSDSEISVYAFNNRRASADAAVILPIQSIGKEYVVAAHWENRTDPTGNTNSQSEFLVVATQDNTEIEITPSVRTTDNRPSGLPFVIKLNQGEVFQLQADGDLSGSLVKSTSSNSNDCKNFSVFGGNKWTRVTGDEDCNNANPAYNQGLAADQLYEQMYPINTWGRDYVSVPYELRKNYMLKVIASEDNTKINISGAEFILDAFEF